MCKNTPYLVTGEIPAELFLGGLVQEISYNATKENKLQTVRMSKFPLRKISTQWIPTFDIER